MSESECIRCSSGQSGVRVGRITFVIGSLATGGAERNLVNLVNGMAGLERTVILIAARREPGALAGELDESVATHRIPIERRRLWRGLDALESLLRELQPDIAHSHMFWANLWTAIAASRAGVPAVVTSEHGENRWKKPYHRWLERRVISPRVSRRLCVSRRILRQRRDVDRVPESKLTLINNGVFLPARGQATGHEVPVLGAVGRLVPEKGLDRLLAAAAELHRSGREFRLHLFGDGPLRGRLEAQAVRLGLSDLVHFAGFQTRMDDIYGKLDIFVMPSIQEGQPMALLEAMSWGLPCVATAVGEIPETLGPEGQAGVVDPDDVAALSRALGRLIDDADERVRLGRIARARVEAAYTVERVVEAHLAIYRACLSPDGSDDRFREPTRETGCGENRALLP